MYLKRLVIHGFKSFADRTVIELEPGVTGIVGPNGCGKSNVADAIKWVLGEQSPKSLRASSMQDVLFEGTDTRSPMAFSEVALMFTDCEKELGTAFNEVEVGRRVERDGGSDYFINGKACRLKDIQNLFRDTGIGRVAYSFLQQGQIDRLLSSNPMDRRTVFEEAAGISGFKAKREETLRKLTDVEANLGRLGDILTEVSSSMASLKRQAAKAIRASRLKRQLNSLDQAVLAYDLQSIDEELAKKSVEVAPLEESLTTHQQSLGAQEEALKSVEAQMSDLITRQQTLSSNVFEKRSVREEAMSHARFLTLRAEEAMSRVGALEESLKSLRAEESSSSTQLEEISGQLAAVRQAAADALAKSQELLASHETAQKSYEAAMSEELELRACATAQEGELAGLQARRSALELEQHGLQAQLGPIGAQRESLRADRERISGEAQSSQNHAKVCAEAIEKLSADEQTAVSHQGVLREQNTNAQAAFETSQRAHAQTVAEKNLLEEMNRRYEGFGDATRELLAKGDYTPLVAGLEIEPSAIRAIESLLSLELDAVCPTTLASLPIDSLKNGERIVRPALLSGSQGATVEVSGLIPATNFIRTSPHVEFLRARLQGCYICEDATRFSGIVNGSAEFPFTAIASLEGAVLDSQGLFCAPHAPASAASFITRSQRLKALEEQLSRGEDALQLAKYELTRVDHALQDSDVTLGKIRLELASQKAQLSSYSSAVRKSSESMARLDEQIEKIDVQSASSQARLTSLSTDRAAMQERFEALVASKSQSDARAQALTESLAQMRQSRDAATTALNEARLSEANTRHAVEVAQESQRNLRSRLSELSARISSASAEAERLTKDAADYKTQAAEKTTLAESMSAELSLLEVELQSLKTSLEAQETQSTAARNQMNALREVVSDAQNALMKARLQVGELNGRRGMLMEDLQRRFGESFAVSSLNWRASLYEADFFAKADEASLEMGAVELPSAEELLERYQTLARETLFTDCQTLRGKLEGIGPINESALEDYKAQEVRYTTLKAQVDDLQAAKVELTTALMELESQSSTLFETIFETIRTNFGKTFEQLFGGGKADLILSTPEDPLNSGIEIMARPPGTNLKSLNLLSGGQKTMTAVALLFAIYQVKPSPFCVLDELDAPLDDANIGRFLLMLKGFTAFSQFVIITHNKRTMAASDVLYGVTMQERGVSKVMSMRLQQAQVYGKVVEEKSEEKQEEAIVAEAPVAQLAEASGDETSSAQAETSVIDSVPSEQVAAQAAETVAAYSMPDTATLKAKIAAALSREEPQEAVTEEK